MDLRERLLSEIRESIVTNFDSKQSVVIMDVIITKLINYEITERCTEVSILDDENERLLKSYSACLLVSGRSRSTIDAYIKVLKRLSDFTHKNYKDITTVDIRAWLADGKMRNLKNSSLENMRMYTSSFFKWLCEERIITNSPCDLIKPIKQPKEEKKAFTDEDVDSMRSVCDVKERAVIEFLLSSGVRAREASDMLISDVDFDRLTVCVRHGKGDKERITYITPIAKKHIVAYINSRDDGSPYLFYSRNHGQYKKNGIHGIAARVGKRANVDDAHPHRFRRTLATNLAKRGMPIQEIQKILGHESITTTQGYIDTDRLGVEASYRKYVV